MSKPRRAGVLEVGRREDPVEVVRGCAGRRRSSGGRSPSGATERDRVRAPEPSAERQVLEVRIHLQHAGERRVARRAVVALDGVVEEDLPIGVDRPLELEPVAVAIDVEAASAVSSGRPSIQPARRRLGVDVHPHRRPPDAGLHGSQSERAAIEVRFELGAWCVAQAPVEAIGPGVVRACIVARAGRRGRRHGRGDGRC